MRTILGIAGISFIATACASAPRGGGGTDEHLGTYRVETNSSTVKLDGRLQVLRDTILLSFTQTQCVPDVAERGSPYMRFICVPIAGTTSLSVTLDRRNPVGAIKWNAGTAVEKMMAGACLRSGTDMQGNPVCLQHEPVNGSVRSQLTGLLRVSRDPAAR